MSKDFVSFMHTNQCWGGIDCNCYCPYHSKFMSYIINTLLTLKRMKPDVAKLRHKCPLSHKKLQLADTETRTLE